MCQCWKETGEQPHQDRPGGHEQLNVRVSEHWKIGDKQFHHTFFVAREQMPFFSFLCVLRKLSGRLWMWSTRSRVGTEKAMCKLSSSFLVFQNSLASKVTRQELLSETRRGAARGCATLNFEDLQASLPCASLSLFSSSARSAGRSRSTQELSAKLAMRSETSSHIQLRSHRSFFSSVCVHQLATHLCSARCCSCVELGQAKGRKTRKFTTTPRQHANPSFMFVQCC